MIFDTHAHYDDKKFDEDREVLMENLKKSGIHCVVNVSSDLASVQETIHLTQKYDFIYGALGVHPSDSGELTKETFQWVKENCKREKIVAVGEIGLDYYWNEPEPSVQKEWFVKQLAMAREISLPVIIHSRDAAKDTYDLMKENHAEEIGGVIHCYSYSKEMARDFLNMGFYFGIGGVVTFSNGKKLKDVVEYLPMDKIVLETDCPYLAPVPHRGKRNSSLNLIYVAEEIASIKKIPVEEVYRMTYENARCLYRMDKYEGNED